LFQICKAFVQFLSNIVEFNIIEVQIQHDSLGTSTFIFDHMIYKINIL